MIKKCIEFVKSLINTLEKASIPFYYYILTFFFATTLRNFLEVFSDDTPILQMRFFHYYLSYIAMSLSFIQVFYSVTKDKISNISKVIFPCFILVILAATIDLVISSFNGANISYFLPDVHQNLVKNFFFFFGPLTKVGISLGMRIEIALVLIGSFLYFFVKTHKIIDSFLGSFIMYCVLFIFGMMPFFLQTIFSFIGLPYQYSDRLFFHFYMLLSFILGVFIAYLADKKKFMIILRDIRPFRVLHFQFMFVLGIIFAIRDIGFQLTTTLLFSFFFIPISILFACLYSIIMNNLEDVKIDQISNPDRPLVKGTISIHQYKEFSYIFIILSLVFAAIVDFKALFFITTFIGNYFLYSVRPLRLKRIPIVSKFFISLNSLLLVMMGYSLVNDTAFSVYFLPTELLYIFLIGYTLVLNFIDIKDYEGDKSAGLTTFVGLVGLKTSKILIGLFFLLVYLSVYFVLEKVILLIPLSIFGLLEFYLINKKRYQEKAVFIVYLFSLLLLFFVLLKF